MAHSNPPSNPQDETEGYAHSTAISNNGEGKPGTKQEKNNTQIEMNGITKGLVIATWLIAGATVFSSIYQACLNERVFKENARQFADTLEEMKAQTGAASVAARAAEKATESAKRSVESSRKLVDSMREQNAIFSESVRLGQRAWVGYTNYILQSRKDKVSPWENREPQRGEETRVRFALHNTGKTPAMNVYPVGVVAKIVNPLTPPPIPKQWGNKGGAVVVFPENTTIFHNMSPFSLKGNQFSDYVSREKVLFFWVKFYYCDISRNRHWTRVGVSHTWGAGFAEFDLINTSISPDPGEINHPDCQDQKQ